MRRVFFRAAALLLVLSLSLRMRGFSATQKALQKNLLRSAMNPRIKPSISDGDGSGALLVARAVDAAARHGLGNPTCLEKSLALWWMLGREGIASTVRIGTRKSGDKFEAHAWVECAGMVLNEPQELHRHYAAFDETFPGIPPPGRE